MSGMEASGLERSRLSFVWTLFDHGALAILGLLVYVMVTRIGRHRRQPSAAVAWVVLIAALPYVGLPLFLFFGTRKYARPRMRLAAATGTPTRELNAAPASGGEPGVEAGPAVAGPAWATQLLVAFEMPPPTAGNRVAFQEDGQASWRALLALFRDAERTLDVCTFLLGDDETGATVVRELERTAARGVRVRLLLDAFGSFRTSRSGLRTLRRAGVTVQWFMPLLHNPLRGRTNLRNHRKLVVADGARVWSGGRNLANEYFVDRPGRPAWEDLSFTVHGPLATHAQALFDHDWSMASGRGRRAVSAVSAADEGEALPDAAAMPSWPVETEGAGGAVAQIIASGPDHADDTVYSLLLSAAYQARRRLRIATPYFVPDDALLSALCLACRRGVRVTVLIPARSNHRLADIARERSVRQLVRAGGKVLLDPEMMHAKAVVIDDRLALCGTANVDTRSLLLNFEVMAAFYGRAEIAWLDAWISGRADRASPAEARLPGWWRDVLEGVVRAVGYQL